jgi:PST family polysaccharide transporter
VISLPKKFKSYDNLIKNFTSLSILQIANYLFPLIVLPYVVRVLGPAKFGLINFAAAFIAYFGLICDYGFSLSGTKAVSIIRDSKSELSKIFSSIITIKVILFCVAFVVLLAFISFIPLFKKDWELYLISYGIVLGNVLFPMWFFQGIEQMKYITLIQVFIRSIATVLIFLLIKEEADYILLVVLYSSTQILIGVIGIITAVTKFQLKLSLQPFNILKSHLISGWNIFLSMVSINLYTTSNTFILGLFASEATVGYYAAADKIRIAFQGLQSVMSQSVFPYVNKLAKESKARLLSFNKQLLKLEGVVSLIVSIILFAFAHQLSDLILGPEFSLSGKVLRILSILPFLISLNNVFGIHTMIPLGFEKSFSSIISGAAIVHIVLLLILIPQYFAIGTAIVVSITELLITVLMFLFLKKHKISFFKYV